MDGILKAVTERGINLLRVPISTELLHEWSTGAAAPVQINDWANPELAGMTSLELFDEFLAQSEKYGLKVMLDVHSAKADNSGHIAPLWFDTTLTEDMFFNTWEWFANRYKNNDTLVAFDIENEPHGLANETRAKWDSSTDSDNWKYACEEASNRILNINPDVLVMCEGIQVYPLDGLTWNSTNQKLFHNTWWGGNLRGVTDHPVNLGTNQDQLVYSPHEYGPKVFLQPWFQKTFTKQSLLDDVWRPNWFFLQEQNISPLFIGEWGGFMDAGDNELWMGFFRDFMHEHFIHHTFWVINPNSGDTGGLLMHDWKTWDEHKYSTMLEPVLWQNAAGIYIGLDHEVPLGGVGSTTGITVSEHYATGGSAPAGPFSTVVPKP